MQWKDIKPDVIVYHSAMVHWGQGVVIKIIEYSYNKVIKVKFEQLQDFVNVELRSLRKTPNIKKINSIHENLKNSKVKTKINEDHITFEFWFTKSIL